CMESLEFLWTF
nr:immunoglobulin light chain junction region [Macaca mulatta]